MTGLLMQTRSAISIMYEKDVLQGLIATALLMIILFGAGTVILLRAKQRKEQPFLFYGGAILFFAIMLTYIYRLYEWLHAYFTL